MNTTTLRVYLNELITLYSKKPLGILNFEDREFYNDLSCKVRLFSCYDYNFMIFFYCI
jgi:hypothetical protein